MSGIRLEGRTSAAIGLLGLLAVAALIGALVLPVFEIRVNGLPCEPAEVGLAAACQGSGSIFLLPLAALIGAMTLGAGPGVSRPASVALVVAGIAVLMLSLVLDLPKIGETGAIGLNFEAASSAAGPGFWLELAGGLLAVAGGGLGVARRER